tara:strand:+ start:23679 stop:23906 length:228 start_codon:yes stop_codon:yes gene_type:complete
MQQTDEMRWLIAPVEPPPRNYKAEKEALRRQLEADTARYLQRGGRIDQVDHQANRNPQFGLGTMHSIVPGRQISL